MLLLDDGLNDGAYGLLDSMKIRILKVLIWVWSITLVVNSRADDPTQESLELDGFEVAFPAMGTLVKIRGYAKQESDFKDAVNKAQKRVLNIEEVLSDYEPESEAALLTQQALEKNVRVSDDLWQVLMASDRWFRISNGAFDASLGRVTKLWRTQRRTQQPAQPEDIRDALANSGWGNVELYPEQQAVRVNRPVRMDFGAIGKGYAVDAAFEVLTGAGIDRCMVNMSGNMRLGKAPPNRTGWRIDVAPLQDKQPPIRQLILAQTAIATSGDLWQFTIVDGQRRSHILDPKTGYGVVGPIAATVLASTATDADACATALCVLGVTQGGHLIQTLPGIEALIVEQRAPGPIRYLSSEHFTNPIPPKFPVRNP